MEDITDVSDVFDNDIEMYFNLFCEECDPPIKDMTKEPQSRWNACLMYINKKVFRNTDKLKQKSCVPSNGIMPSNHGSYDMDKVTEVLDIYLYLCAMFDKECSDTGFCLLTGINRDTICDWRNGERKLDTRMFEVAKKLREYREESLSNKLATGSKNPVGVLAILNRHYQWNLPGVSRERLGSAKMTAADLPKLGGNPEQFEDRNCLKIPTIQESSK